LIKVKRLTVFGQDPFAFAFKVLELPSVQGPPEYPDDCENKHS